MTYDNELALIKKEVKIIPPGIPEETETRTTLLCNVKSAGQAEFYKGRQSGLRPEIEFVIHAFEYNNEREIEFEKSRYSVIRTYKKSFEEIELICEIKKGDVDGAE